MSGDIPYDLDLPQDLVPKPGTWRVVEFVSLSDAQVLERLEALGAGILTGTDAAHAHLGTFRRVVGDYDDLGIALDIMSHVAFPHSRRVFTHMGAEVAGYQPGSSDPPTVASES